MASMQLNFTLRTSPNCKTVHLLGSWDNYRGQLPLGKDASKSGAWKGSFRFQQTMLKPGQRYWYYYIIDGYHVSHNPSKPSTVEPTTSRRLNILDAPAADTSDNRPSRGNLKLEIPRGRGVSPSQVVSPQPKRPKNQRPLSTRDFGGKDVVQALSRQFADTKLVSSFSDDDTSDSDSAIDSDASSDVPSLSSSRSSRSASSVSSRTSSCCTCNRYGITRKGDRVKLDCGGSRCGSEIEDESCSESEHEERLIAANATRRQGVYIRSSGR